MRNEVSEGGLVVLFLFVLATEAIIEILKEWVIFNDSVTLILRIYGSTDRRKYNYLKSYNTTVRLNFTKAKVGGHFPDFD